MRSASAASIGAQRPRVSNVPDHASSSGPEAVELMAAGGLVLDDWQAWTLTQILGEREDGRWAATEAGLCVPRQNGKTSGILVARALAGLFLLGERLIIFTSHEFKACAEAFLSAKSIIEQSDDFAALVATIRTSHGEESVILKDGRRLRFLARSKSSVRGFACDCLILDEAFALTDKHMAAIFPSGSASANRQIIYASMAGDEGAHEWKRIRQRGHEGSARLCWLEWSADDKARLDDPKAWAQANPGYGIRLSQEAVEDEREALSEENFARERLGIWRGRAHEAIIPDDRWIDVLAADAAPVEPLQYAIDVLPDRSAGAIVVAGGGAVEMLTHGTGVSWIARETVARVRKHPGVVLVDKLSPAASIADDIEAKGITVERLGTADVASACARFYDAVMDAEIRVRPHELLTTAVSGAVKKTLGDRFVWSRARSAHDVTPLFAASLACFVREGAEDFAMVV